MGFFKNLFGADHTVPGNMPTILANYWLCVSSAQQATSALGRLSFVTVTKAGLSTRPSLAVKIFDLQEPLREPGALVVVWGSVTEAERAELEALRQSYEDSKVKHTPEVKELILKLSAEFQSRAEALLKKSEQPPR